MTKATTDTRQQRSSCDDAQPSFDTIEVAATLRWAADLARDAAEHFALLGEVLRLLVEEGSPHLGSSSSALLAAKVSIWNARQSAREFEAAHETLSMEADRYAC